jgi:hypothetical protein
MYALNGGRKEGQYGINLSSSKFFRWQEVPCDGELLERSLYRPRTWHTCCDLGQLQRGDEVDIVVYIIGTFRSN